MNLSDLVTYNNKLHLVQTLRLCVTGSSEIGPVI